MVWLHPFKVAWVRLLIVSGINPSLIILIKIFVKLLRQVFSFYRKKLFRFIRFLDPTDPLSTFSSSTLLPMVVWPPMHRIPARHRTTLSQSFILKFDKLNRQLIKCSPRSGLRNLILSLSLWNSESIDCNLWKSCSTSLAGLRSRASLCWFLCSCVHSISMLGSFCVVSVQAWLCIALIWKKFACGVSAEECWDFGRGYTLWLLPEKPNCD